MLTATSSTVKAESAAQYILNQFEWPENPIISEDCATVRIEKTDAQARKWECPKEATGEGATSKTLDQAADSFLRMRVDTTAVPKAKLTEVIIAAKKQGLLTREEIASHMRPTVFTA